MSVWNWLGTIRYWLALRWRRRCESRRSLGEALDEEGFQPLGRRVVISRRRNPNKLGRRRAK